VAVGAEQAEAEHRRSYLAYREWATTGRLEALDDAIVAAEASLRLTPPAGADYAPRANDYGMFLRQRYDDRGTAGDLWKSVSALRAAVNRTPPDDEQWAGRVMNLGNALTRLHELTHGAAPLDEAIERLEEVVRDGPTADPERGMHLSSLSRSLRIRDGQGDLARSVELDADALAVTPAGSEDRPRLLGNAANGLSRLAHGRDARWREAIALWEQACRLAVDEQPAVAITSSLVWLDAALQRDAHGDAIAAVELARRALDRLVSAQADRRDQEQWLSLAQRLPSLAAQVLVGVGDVEGAVTAVEHARASLLSRLLEQRGAGSRTFAELRELARRSGPLAYVVPAEHGLALVVDGEGARAVPLPRLTPDAVLDAVSHLYRGYFSREEDPRMWRDGFDEVARWLWDAAMGPLLAALGPDRRLNLLAGDRLALLPLHAAWAPGGASRRRYACDEALITVQPNAQIMMRAARRAATGTVVAVADPQPSSERSLRWAVAEAHAAAAAGPLDLYAREDATVENVLDAMAGADIVHLACHGRADVEDPLAGGLVLADDRVLTVGQLMEGELDARLVVVTACESASVSPRLPDEVVGLASSLLSAGSGAVLASAFVVDDFNALVVAAHFYASWANGVPGVEALRDAVAFLRDTTNAEKAAWVAATRGAGVTPQVVADALEVMLDFARPGERSFEHPVEWAPFTWWGADARA
jgi:tetratricopeptide (TPR) repeat protein